MASEPPEVASTSIPAQAINYDTDSEEFNQNQVGRGEKMSNTNQQDNSIPHGISDLQQSESVFNHSMHLGFSDDNRPL